MENDVDRNYELVSAIVLDPVLAEIAYSDASRISAATGASDTQSLSIARGEAWRQLRARSVFVHDVPLVGHDADPVAGLTAMERTVLVLSLRLGLNDATVAEVCAISVREAATQIKNARRELARTAIAITLMTNPSRCPVIEQAHTTLGESLTRGQVMHLVTHSAECSICVPVLRTVDRRIIEDYRNAPAMAAPQASANESMSIEALVGRAKLKNGFAPADETIKGDPKKLLRRATLWGAVSTLLLIAGLVLLGMN